MKGAKWHFRDEKINFSAFSVADATLLDSEFGLIFISLDKEILVTLPINYYIDFFRLKQQRKPSGCMEGEQAGLTRLIRRANAKGAVSIIRIPPVEEKEE